MNSGLMKRILSVIPVLILVACERPTISNPPIVPPVPPAPQDTCRASQNDSLIGQDATSLERVLLVGQVRVIRPGQAVTADFRPERINFDIDVNNKISSVRCG